MEALGLFSRLRLPRPTIGGGFCYHPYFHNTLSTGSSRNRIDSSLASSSSPSSTISLTNLRASGGPNDTPNDNPSNQEFHLNVGKAIDTLRTELPYYFERGLQDYSIYHDNITLSEPQHYRFYIRGLNWYRRFLGCARNVMNWYFSDLTLNIQSISRPADNELHIRWQMEGTPNTLIFRQNLRSYLSRSGWFFVSALKPSFGTTSGGRHDESGDVLMVEKTVYEGRFVYRFGRTDGKVVEHSIENLLPAPKTFVPLSAISWWQRGSKFDLELNSSTRL